MVEIDSRIFNNADWATKGVTSHRITIAWHLAAPIVKLLVAILVAYMSAGLVRSKPRLNSAVVSATLSSFLTCAYLYPMMIQRDHSTSDAPIGRDVELAQVALGVLSLYAALVGAALGSLLPRPMGGATLGCGLAMALVMLLPKNLVWNNGNNGLVGQFVVWGPILAVVGGVLATR
jgi:hypothetical protein